jgi:hypothetical protein
MDTLQCPGCMNYMKQARPYGQKGRHCCNMQLTVQLQHGEYWYQQMSCSLTSDQLMSRVSMRRHLLPQAIQTLGRQRNVVHAACARKQGTCAMHGLRIPSQCRAWLGLGSCWGIPASSLHTCSVCTHTLQRRTQGPPAARCPQLRLSAATGSMQLCSQCRMHPHGRCRPGLACWRPRSCCAPTLPVIPIRTSQQQRHAAAH